MKTMRFGEENGNFETMENCLSLDFSSFFLFLVVGFGIGQTISGSYVREDCRSNKIYFGNLLSQIYKLFLFVFND